ncbi:MAG: ATP-sensitive inward rectifier potassium channel 10 [Proteobacteria bacterium]|nr:ATP-sensitive inward rectifier potassium channel 10 [Pseudomonadota bacterium]
MSSERDKKGPPTASALVQARRGQRVAIVRGQDQSRYTDIYHAVLNAPWWVFFLGLAVFFALINAVFALLYIADPQALAHARHGNFWDAYLFSVETIGSVNYTVFVPQTTFANVIVSIEAFFGILTIALFTGIIFARFSRPFARIVFSRVAVITPFDGVPTLMFRAANQRGNQILDAEIRLSMACQKTTREGITMRRFEDLKPSRERTSLFALSWTIMHRIDRHSPLYGMTFEQMLDQQVEIIAMLSGTDETLADRVYARHSYRPDCIQWNRHFVDVISVSPRGLRVVDLTRFHDTEEITPAP